MARITIEFDVDNAAFYDHNERLDLDAVAESLTSVVRKLRAGCTDGRVLDTNGNTVGTFAITDDD